MSKQGGNMWEEIREAIWLMVDEVIMVLLVLGFFLLHSTCV